MGVSRLSVSDGRWHRYLATLRSSIRNNERLIAVAVAVYFFGGVLGLVAGSTLDYVQLAQMSDVSATGRAQAGAGFTEILTANLGVGALLVSGVVTFGAAPLVLLFSNGIFHFYYVGLAPVDPFETAVLLVPHGVFELPGFWIAAAVGFRVPSNLVDYLRGTRDTIAKRTELVEMGALCALAVVLIVVGAAVEATVTTALADRFV